MQIKMYINRRTEQNHAAFSGAAIVGAVPSVELQLFPFPLAASPIRVTIEGAPAELACLKPGQVMVLSIEAE